MKSWFSCCVELAVVSAAAAVAGVVLTGGGVQDLEGVVAKVVQKDGNTNVARAVPVIGIAYHYSTSAQRFSLNNSLTRLDTLDCSAQNVIHRHHYFMRIIQRIHRIDHRSNSSERSTLSSTTLPSPTAQSVDMPLSRGTSSHSGTGSSSDMWCSFYNSSAKAQVTRTSVRPCLHPLGVRISKILSEMTIASLVRLLVS